MMALSQHSCSGSKHAANSLQTNIRLYFGQFCHLENYEHGEEENYKCSCTQDPSHPQFNTCTNKHIQVDTISSHITKRKRLTQGTAHPIWGYTCSCCILFLQGHPHQRSTRHKGLAWKVFLWSSAWLTPLQIKEKRIWNCPQAETSCTLRTNNCRNRVPVTLSSKSEPLEVASAIFLSPLANKCKTN